MIIVQILLNDFLICATFGIGRFPQGVVRAGCFAQVCTAAPPIRQWGSFVYSRIETRKKIGSSDMTLCHTSAKLATRPTHDLTNKSEMIENLGPKTVRRLSTDDGCTISLSS